MWEWVWEREGEGEGQPLPSEWRREGGPELPQKLPSDATALQAAVAATPAATPAAAATAVTDASLGVPGSAERRPWRPRLTLDTGVPVPDAAPSPAAAATAAASAAAAKAGLSGPPLAVRRPLLATCEASEASLELATRPPARALEQALMPRSNPAAESAPARRCWSASASTSACVRRPAPSVSPSLQRTLLVSKGEPATTTTPCSSANPSSSASSTELSSTPTSSACNLSSAHSLCSFCSSSTPTLPSSLHPSPLPSALSSASLACCPASLS